MGGSRSARANRRRGVALVMVLVVIAVLTSFVMINAVVLTRLGKFLRQVEREQIERSERAPAGAPAEKEPK